MEAVFRVEGDRVETRAHAGGPWDPTMQHGSAPSSLIVFVAERIATSVPMRTASVMETGAAERTSRRFLPRTSSMAM